MKKLLLILITLLYAYCVGLTQPIYKQQYFDGADTSVSKSIIIDLDTSSTNIWQIGSPHKVMFNSAATQPNVLITDTALIYPDTNISRFSFQFATTMSFGIGALQWKQKIDFDKKKDGGIIEYSTDTGKTWLNVFNNPYVYSFYGFNTANKDTLVSGEYAFSGTDTSWKDIWLCFNNSYFYNKDLKIRFTLKSDSINNFKEGWMIDNMVMRETFIHTVKETEQKEYLRVYPTPTTGMVTVEAQKLRQYHIIKSMQLINMNGEVVEQFGETPTKFFIDISKHPDGQYFLKVTTNIKTETLPVILKK
jgi:hypothetical protein